MPDRFIPITPDTEQSQQLAIINRNFGELDQESTKKIYNGNDGVPRIFIDGTTGLIKVAPEGVDVTTAEDAELTFNSEQNVLKVVLTGTLTITPDASWTAGTVVTASVAHTLDYRPAFQVFAEVPSYGAGFPQENQLTNLPTMMTSNTGGDTGAQLAIFAQARADDTNLSVDLINTYTTTTINNSPEWNFRYYILQESAN